MTKAEIAAAFMVKMENADLEGLRELTDAEYRHLDAFMPPLDREAMWDFVKALREAFPYWESNLEILGEIGEDTLKAMFAPTAIHAGTFRFPGITPVKPTGITLALPRSLIFFRFKGDKIAETRVEHPTFGGMAGVLRYLGVDLGETEGEP